MQKPTKHEQVLTKTSKFQLLELAANPEAGVRGTAKPTKPTKLKQKPTKPKQILAMPQSLKLLVLTAHTQTGVWRWGGG